MEYLAKWSGNDVHTRLERTSSSIHSQVLRVRRVSMKYVIRKITGLIIALLIVSMLTFLAFELIPGDPARALLGTEGTEEQVQALREEMGLNRPLPQPISI